MNKTLQKLTQNILQEKIKTSPDENKIQAWQNSIGDIKNYKKNGISNSKQRKINCK